MQSTHTQNGLQNTINTAGLPNYSNNNPNSNNNTSSADLVLVGHQQRHHRDLFTGSLGLGIPDVTTHVGSVIHAFESMAQNRIGGNSSISNMEIGEKPYELFGSVTNKTFKSPNINNCSSQRKCNTSGCSSSNVPKKSSENMQKTVSQKFDQQNQQCHTISQYHLEPPSQHHVHHPPQSSKQNVRTFNIPVSDNHRSTLQKLEQHQRQKPTTTTIGDGYVKTGEIFYHPEWENDASNFDAINTNDYRKNLFGTHPNVTTTNIDGRIFHSQPNGNYDIVNFIDLTRKQNHQRPMSSSIIETKMRKSVNSRNPEVFYGKPTQNIRPTSDIIQSHRNNSRVDNNNDDYDDDHYNDNFNFNNDLDDDPTFLRGSTVSQSFIKNVKNQKNNPISSTSSTSNYNNGFKHDRMFNSSNNSNHSKSNKRHKSANELSSSSSPVEWKTRYNYNNENFDARNSTKRQSFKPRTIDRAVI